MTTSKSTKLFAEINQFLADAEEYFDQFADAEYDADGRIDPNTEMRLLQDTREAMLNLVALTKAMHEEELERLDRAFAKLEPVK